MAGPDRPRTLSRAELTAALAARQMLIAREHIPPAAAIRRLTPLQAQHPPAPYIALAARLDGFGRAGLEAAIGAGQVLKTTIMRVTLHLAAGEDYPAYAQLVRQARLRTWRRTFAHLDEAAVTAELRDWFRTPRTNAEIRERVRGYEGAPDEPWPLVWFARTLLPLVQLPPGGFWTDGRRAEFVVDPRPLPDPADAAAMVLTRYLAAFGPASRRDVAAWAGVPQREFAAALTRVPTAAHRDERGAELLDLPGAPLPDASTPLPPRFLGHWDQPLLAYADRERIMSPEVAALKLTISGAPTVTVDGRVAASWALVREGGDARVEITPHTDIPRRSRTAIRAEAERTARFCAPDAARVTVAGLPT
jgi:hypothetical protein